MGRQILIYGGFRKRFYSREASISEISRTRYGRKVRQFPKVRTIISLEPTIEEDFVVKQPMFMQASFPFLKFAGGSSGRGMRLTDTLYATLCTFVCTQVSVHPLLTID